MTVTATLLMLALATGASTVLGGFVALKRRDRRHLILGFSAGAVLGVAFFDLLPEAVSLGGPRMTGLVALAFLLYVVLDRMIGLKHEAGAQRGTLRAIVLSIHSALDGVAIGVAFQASAALGAVVAVAVLAHDFSDGINTVSAVLKDAGAVSRARKWLLVDAIAPMAGIVSTLFFSVPETALGPILAVFAGFFLYMSATDLIPESYHAHPTKWTTIMTILGSSLIYLVIKIAA